MPTAIATGHKPKHPRFCWALVEELAALAPPLTSADRLREFAQYVEGVADEIGWSIQRLTATAALPCAWSRFFRWRAESAWPAELLGHLPPEAGAAVRQLATDAAQAVAALVAFVPDMEDDDCGEPDHFEDDPERPGRCEPVWLHRVGSAARYRLANLAAAADGHLRRLAEESQAEAMSLAKEQAKRVKSSVELFAGSTTIRMVKPAVPLHRSKRDGALKEAASDLLEVLATAAGGLTGEEVARTAGGDYEYARKLLPTMEAEGLISHDQTGYRITPAGRTAV